MSMIDYNAQAALYLGTSRRAAVEQGPRRFPSAAKAIRFAMEEAPPVSLKGARLVVGRSSFSSTQLRAMYGANAYPFTRKNEQTRLSLEPAEA